MLANRFIKEYILYISSEVRSSFWLGRVVTFDMPGTSNRINPVHLKYLEVWHINVIKYDQKAQVTLIRSLL